VVEAVGEDVDKGWLGESAATIPGFSQNRYGTLGEEAVVSSRSAGQVPGEPDAGAGLAIWMQYLTAYGALVLVGGVKAGDFVSIPAASSSVGLAAIQIARDQGATAIAVTRTAAKRTSCWRWERIAWWSATQKTTWRGQGDHRRAGARITFDPVAGPGIETLAAGASQGGILIEYGALAGAATPFPLVTSMLKGLSVRATRCCRSRATPPRPPRERSTSSTGWPTAVCAPDCADVRICRSRRGLPVPGVEPAGGQGCDLGSVKSQ